MRSGKRSRFRRRIAMGTEILGASDRLLAAVLNGIYQGILITVLVALSFRVFSRTNAATRHAVWLCTLWHIVFHVLPRSNRDRSLGPQGRQSKRLTRPTSPPSTCLAECARLGR